ncbi:hypothetical protein ACFYYM_17935 [Streptomyces erythrochromogenes]|uniref:hypothetical protein n=1 Tax=Streptomyces erythrochromogenes TaxID=285574 RepID=UPI0036B4B519
MGVRLPAAPGEAYRLLGRRRGLTGNHDVLLDPAELYVDDAEEALVSGTRTREPRRGASSSTASPTTTPRYSSGPTWRSSPPSGGRTGWTGFPSASARSFSKRCDFLHPDDDSLELL